MFLDGAYHDAKGELAWRELGHLKTSEVGEVLEHAVRRMEKHLRRRGALESSELSGDDPTDEAEANLAASAVSGQTPPAGPQWTRGLSPLQVSALAYDKPLCAALDGFTLHAATRAGAHDAAGREALLRYVLRPPIAQHRVEHRPDGLVRITLKRAFADGTFAVDMDPLSLLCRLATSVPPPRFHTVTCHRRNSHAGVLAPASPWRSRIAPPGPKPAGTGDAKPHPDEERPPKRGVYRGWAELLARTFSIDVLCCPKCSGRMKLLAVVTDPNSLSSAWPAFARASEAGPQNLPLGHPGPGPGGPEGGGGGGVSTHPAGGGGCAARGGGGGCGGPVRGGGWFATGPFPPWGALEGSLVRHAVRPGRQPRATRRLFRRRALLSMERRDQMQTARSTEPPGLAAGAAPRSSITMVAGNHGLRLP